MNCCERALRLVEELLNSNCDQGLSIYARTKKNSLLLRIRSLRKRQIENDETRRTRISAITNKSFTSTFKPTTKCENLYDNNLSSRTISSILSSHIEINSSEEERQILRSCRIDCSNIGRHRRTSVRTFNSFISTKNSSSNHLRLRF